MNKLNENQLSSYLQQVIDMYVKSGLLNTSNIKQSLKVILTFYLLLNISTQSLASNPILENITCNAGRDTFVLVCINTELIDVSQYISSDADPNGFWVNGDSTFDPSTFNGKTFRYIVNDGVCVPDTAIIQVNRRQSAGLSIFINRVCYGDSIFFNGQWYLEPGFYDDSIKYVNTQCDSVVDRLAFFSTAAPIYQSIDTILCPEDSIFFAGQWRKQPTMIDTLISYNETDCDSLIGTLNLSFFPQTDFSVLGVDTICQGEPLILSANLTINSYEWSTGDTEVTTEVSQGGNYVVTATDTNACEIIKNIDVPSYPVTILNGTSFYLVTMDSLLTLDISSNNIITSTNWSSEEVDIDCINCLTPQILVTDTTAITLAAIDENGCEASFDIFIEYKKEPIPPVFYSPTIFNPNSPILQNRSFYLQSEDPIPYALKVYNRWGNLVFSNLKLVTNQPDSAWDGTYNGSLLENGVYSYQVNIGNNTKQGSITLIR